MFHALQPRPRTAALSLAVFLMIVFTACSPRANEGDPNLPGTGAQNGVTTCAPTAPDMLGPFYVPGAPERDSVGTGYVLRGAVRAAGNCAAINNAMVELWMAGPGGLYADEYRAVVYSGDDGAYQFESHFPPGYAGRPPHIHIRVTAPGFEELVTQHYPVLGTEQAVFDLVLEGE